MIKQIGALYQVTIHGPRSHAAVDWSQVHGDVSQEAKDWCADNNHHLPLKFRWGDDLSDPAWPNTDKFIYYFTFLDYTSALHFDMRWS